MEPYIGQIWMVAFNFAPRGFLLCNGQLMPIASYAALFSLIGTYYGGDGQTTFAVPDLRGRLPVSYGQGPGLSSYNIGQTRGVETMTLTSINLPSHTHVATLAATSTPATRQQPGAAMLAAGGAYGTVANTTAAAPTLASTGGGQPLSIRQPSLAINFVIAAEGIYPSRA